MVKGISFLCPSGNPAAYERLSSFLAALGFASGKGCAEEGSRSASFLAPLGNLELVDGRFPPAADILVEVTSLDAVHQAAEAWLRSNGGEAAALFDSAGGTGATGGNVRTSQFARSLLGRQRSR